MNGADIVRARLAAIGEVTALVSTRIYALMLREGVTLPAMRVTVVSTAEGLHLRGMTGVRVERVQVDAYAATLASARAVMDAAFGDGAASGLAAWSGSIGSPATAVDLIEPLSRSELFEPEELQEAIVSQDFYVRYRA
jgi:hypothetical protein